MWEIAPSRAITRLAKLFQYLLVVVLEQEVSLDIAVDKIQMPPQNIRCKSAGFHCIGRQLNSAISIIDNEL